MASLLRRRNRLEAFLEVVDPEADPRALPRLGLRWRRRGVVLGEPAVELLEQRLCLRALSLRNAGSASTGIAAYITLR